MSAPMPLFPLFGTDVMAAASGATSAAATSALSSFLLPFSLFGGALSVLGGIQRNKAIEQSARKQQLIEQFKAADRKAEIARVANSNAGSIIASSADRNAFGQSSKQVALNEIAKGLNSQSIVQQQKALNILSIANQAKANKSSLLEDAVGGAVSGLQFGVTMRGLNL